MVSPQNLGGYDLEREIGRGSFGVVYLARHPQTGKTKAIKILLPWAQKDDELRRRLRREAKLASFLKSPHSVRVEDCQEANDRTVYLIMELLEGKELTSILQESGKLPLERVQSIALQTLDALQEAHRLGVIHRDLKPNNIFICRGKDGEDFVKVLDFGIAKVAAGGNIQETTRLTASGGILGTPPYMSPEQCLGETLTPASDIYSLGIVLYEMLVGFTPFNDDNPTAVLMMQCSDKPDAFPDAIADTPLCRAVMRALEKKPEMRFASAADFRAAILGKEVPVGVPQPVPLAPRDADAISATATATVAPPSTPAPSPATNSASPSPRGGAEKSGCLKMILAIAVAGLAIAGSLPLLLAIR